MSGGGPAMSPEGLEHALRAAEPGVFLVPPRLLRRVIRKDRDLSGLAPAVPHRKSYAIPGERLLRFVDREEIGLRPGEPAPETAILLVRPDADDLDGRPRGEGLVQSWRLLFHARVHLELERQLAAGRLGRARVRERIVRIGQVEFDEIREVLRDERMLLPPRGDAATYIEFAAVYLELKWFDPGLIPAYFPSLRDRDAIDRLLAENLDDAGLFERTRPGGAPDPIVAGESDDEGDEAPEDEPPLGRPVRSPLAYQRLMALADEAAGRGNSVRAAILRTRATRIAPPGTIGRTREAARAELDRLASRLGHALELGDEEVRRWRRAFPPLLARSTRGVLSRGGRLLYDLQKVCIDHERAIFRLDPVGWALSMGRRPIRRPLPALREVLIVKHLRGASRRLSLVRLGDRERNRLAAPLFDALHRAEHALRERLRPLVVSSLARAGLEPRDLVERVAGRKLVEELLDEVVDHGYLTLGDLRDAVSRSNLKLPDLAGPVEFLRGNRLLKADRELGAELEGVYHRGEIYLRWLQRFSTLAFGTAVGRFLTLYVALPFGGAFVALEGLQHLVNLVAWPLAHAEVHLLNPGSFAVAGLLLLGLIHARNFRREFFRASRLLFLALRTLLYDLPSRLLGSRVIRDLLASPALRAATRTIAVPGLVSAASWVLLPPSIRHRPLSRVGAAAECFALALLFNSRFGRDLGESAADGLGWALHRLRIGILPALYRFVMDVFGRLREGIDRLLYTVDEWLRFRSGQNRAVLVCKAILGVAWAGVTYVVRFCVNLLIEPQINPIKHFPVVTVAHKVLITTLPTLQAAFVARGYGRAEAGTMAFTILAAIPGIFGFLVWELKENWRLYEANRPTTLRPVAIGHHGETLSRLLRPGFHSGTLPRLFHRLRRAERKARAGRRRKATLKYREALHHAAEAIRQFVERELVELLRESATLGPLAIEAGGVEAGSNRVRVELTTAALDGEPLGIAFDEQSGWLLASIDPPGWLPRLDEDARLAFEAALAGLYKMAGVDLVREQILAGLSPDPPAYDIADGGLVVWPDRRYESEAIYDLRDGPVLTPQPRTEPPAKSLPTLDRGRLLFRDVAIPWPSWRDAWEHDRAGQGPPDPLVNDFRLLPAEIEAPIPESPP